MRHISLHEGGVGGGVAAMHAATHQSQRASPSYLAGAQESNALQRAATHCNTLQHRERRGIEAQLPGAPQSTNKNHDAGHRDAHSPARPKNYLHIQLGLILPIGGGHDGGVGGGGGDGGGGTYTNA